jgi:hypothetical protein
MMSAASLKLDTSHSSVDEWYRKSAAEMTPLPFLLNSFQASRASSSLLCDVCFCMSCTNSSMRTVDGHTLTLSATSPQREQR